MSWIRASSMDQLGQCPGELVLPKTLSEVGESAHWGTAVHGWAESGYIAASPKYPGHQKHLEKKLAKYDRGQIWPSGVGAYREMALVRNTLTGEAKAMSEGTKEAKEEWKASFGDEWESGTADYVNITNGMVWVDDLKTGRNFVKPADSLQLRWYLLAVCALNGKPLQGGRVSILHLPRYPVDCDAVRHESTVSGRELEAMRDWLFSLRKLYTGGKVETNQLNPGNACLWCKSKEACPVFKNKESK